MILLSLKDLFHHERNSSYILVVSAFFLAALAVYALYFDILLPGYMNGSYRAAVGDWFLIPSAILASGQIFFAGFFLHMIAVALKKGNDFLKATAITSAMTFAFSLTYVMFPFFGPFYYIIFVVTGPSYALPVEIAYSVITVSFFAWLLRKTYGMDWKTSLFVTMALLAGITVAAS